MKNRLRYLLLCAAPLLHSFACPDGRKSTQEMATYECTEPKAVDTGILYVQQGRTYFEFHPQTLLTNPVSLGFGRYRKDSDLVYFAAYLINSTDTTFQATLQDGSPILIQEAQNKQGQWVPVEFWIHSDCGNSYFKQLELGQGEYVMIPIRKYSGSFKTKLRLKMEQSRKTVFYSQPFDGAVDPSQLIQIESAFFYPGMSYLGN